MVTLSDKYTQTTGRVFITGLQAIVRIAIAQARADQVAGLKTGGFVSGYRGSPLSGLDVQFQAAEAVLSELNVRVQPGINEDLAATAVLGTQQLHLVEGHRPNVDGVFGIWYGKGPGVDRSADVFKHGAMAGSSADGGILAVFGDDHANKSSSFPHQSDYTFVACGIPVVAPASVQDYVRFGRLGIEASRFSGCWVAFKAIGETVESSASISVDDEAIPIVTPTDVELPSDDLNIRLPDNPFEQEARLWGPKLDAATAFLRANKIDRVVSRPSGAKLGLAAVGKAYHDVLDCLAYFGVTSEKADASGLAIMKIGLAWPVDVKSVGDFSAGLDELCVVEEKRGLVEGQLSEAFVNDASRPKLITGKKDETGTAQIPVFGETSPRMLAPILGPKLVKYGVISEDQFVSAMSSLGGVSTDEPPQLVRMPFFCAGCPHNTSTKVPEGSEAQGGIGCHAIAMWMPEARAPMMVSQMGGEGVNWIGIEPFSDRKHVFQNIGDGTYFHSGILAIRAAIAAKSNITFKILYNDAVAMTGGQDHDGAISPLTIAAQVMAEGAREVVLLSETPDIYPSKSERPGGISVQSRDQLDLEQKRLREIEGVTILIYDQTCAAEKRRRRKKGILETPEQRLYINPEVCEGCGDCGVQSNCVALQPLDTPFGRKRQIDQAMCNIDKSCVKGFCPSFVGVSGAKLPKPAEKSIERPPVVPEPEIAEDWDDRNILLAGMGGTGVVTAAAVLAMAAHIDGKGVSILDQTGMSQKNGAVTSHVRVFSDPNQSAAVRIPTASADVLLGCDLVVAAQPQALNTCSADRTSAVVSTAVVATPKFIFDPDLDLSGSTQTKAIKERTQTGGVFVDFDELARKKLGSPAFANIALLGAAFQQGLLPISLAALEEAIRLNGVSVEKNISAFNWGRVAVATPDALTTNSDATQVVEEVFDLDDEIELKQRHLTAYQNAVLAKRYRDAVEAVRLAETRVKGAPGDATRAVSFSLAKLMSYKDEYEVARLYSLPNFRRDLEKQLEGAQRLTVFMAPPLISPTDPATGAPKKREFGPWIFSILRILAKGKFLRGTLFDPFGRTEERKMERRLATEFEEIACEIANALTEDNHATAVELLQLPETVRGFGHVKKRNAESYEKKMAELLHEFRNSPAGLKSVAAE